MGENAVDLHGHERQPFPNFGEYATYLERVTVPDEAEAMEVLREEGMDAELPLFAIWMRYGPAETGPQSEAYVAWGDSDGIAWWECDEDHPDAVPFWKDSEPEDSP